MAAPEPPDPARAAAPPAPGGAGSQRDAMKSGVIYLASSVVNKAIPFLLLPVYTHYMTPAELGILSVFMVINSIVDAVAGMSLNANIATNFYDRPGRDFARVVGNILIVLAVTSAAAFAALSAVAATWDVVFSLPSTYLLLMPLLVFMAMTHSVATTIMRNEGRARVFAAFEIGHAVTKAGLAVLLLTAAGLNWRAQVVAMVLAHLAFFFVATGYLRKRRYLTLEPDRNEVRSILHLSLPLVPHALGAIAIGVSDRLFIERMVGIEVVALYSIGYSFGMVMSVITDAVAKSWNPWLYRALATPTDAVKQQIVRSMYVLMGGFIVAAGAVTLFGRLVLPYVVTESFRGAAVYIGWIAFGYMIRGGYQLIYPFMVHLRTTSFLAYSTAAAALLNLVLNFALIRQFGAIGAAYATVGAMAVSTGLVYWYMSGRYTLPWLGK